MGYLTDTEIKRRLIDTGCIKPVFNLNKQLQPTSYDIRLSPNFRVFVAGETIYIDPFETDPGEYTKAVYVEQGHPFVIHPNQAILGETLEYIKIPNDLVGTLEGRSSIGRLFVKVHSTAGFLDPGWEGTITLEITNEGPFPVLLWPGMRIGQVSFETVEGVVERPYGFSRGSKYQGQIGPTVSRVREDKQEYFQDYAYREKTAESK